MMIHATRCLLILTALSMIALSGCGSTVTTDRWQSQVEHYINDQADGDPADLRCVVNAEGEPEFTVLGGNSPADGVDACGHLVDVVDVDGQRWLVYALAQLKDQQVESLRPAAVTRGPAGPRCVIGTTDAAKFKQYVATPSEMAPASAGLEPIHTWPRPGDRFVASAEGSTLTLSELHSGVRWQLKLPAAR